jgi:hypothetical protein
MQGPPGLCKAENQTAWTILVFRIVFYNLTPARYCLFHFNNADLPNDALVNGMLGELILPSEYFALNFLKHTLDSILYHLPFLFNLSLPNEPVGKVLLTIETDVFGGLLTLPEHEILDRGTFYEVIFFCISPKNLLGDFFSSLNAEVKEGSFFTALLLSFSLITTYQTISHAT